MPTVIGYHEVKDTRTAMQTPLVAEAMEFDGVLTETLVILTEA